MNKTLFKTDNSRFGAVLTDITREHHITMRSLLQEAHIRYKRLYDIKKAKATTA